jgi:catechol 2,3-dioxygenase-like lactoylglutathione lyase family enzyme
MSDELTDISGAAISSTLPKVNGLHHIRIPVSDLSATEDWFAQTFGFESILITEAEDRVIGVVMKHASGIHIGLHDAPDRSAALRDFALIGLTVSDLGAWPSQLDAIGVEHGDIIDAHLGKRLLVYGPNGLVVEIHSPIQPSAEDA